MTSPELVIWLQERTALAILSPEILNAIALVLEEQIVPANHRLVLEGTPPQRSTFLNKVKSRATPVKLIQP